MNFAAQDFWQEFRSRALITGGLLALASGFALKGFGSAAAGNSVWGVATAAVLLSLAISSARSLIQGEIGLDLLAAFSMSGALFLEEYLAAIVIAVMYAGGQALERFAAQRAQREMTALLAHRPHTALRHSNGALETIPIERIVPNDRLLVRKGDAIPADGIILSAVAVVNLSSITGEAVPVRLGQGDFVPSGAVNAGEIFDIQVSRAAAESTFAGIVRMVESAKAAKAPMSRLADRFALVFLLVTIAVAALAYASSSDPVRALAVLVVATPCPLILAVPIAFISGLSRIASFKVLVKGGNVLEALTRVRVLVIDKTGTLTHGGVFLERVETAPPVTENFLLQMAASLDQASKNVVAQALVSEASRRGLKLITPSSVVETAGHGIEGVVGERKIIAGNPKFVAGRLGAKVNNRASFNGKLAVDIGIDGRYAGRCIFRDRLRQDARAFLDSMRIAGVHRIILASGDHSTVTAEIARDAGIGAVKSELKPEDKLQIVLDERVHGLVMMIGDGVNDAPALAAAGIGVAMGMSGSGASSEAADVVLLSDELGRLARAMRVARRTKSIALQSVYAGMGLSFGGMVAAAIGYLTPVEGAVFQEFIDIAVIMNALRVLREDEVPAAEAAELKPLAPV